MAVWSGTQDPTAQTRRPAPVGPAPGTAPPTGGATAPAPQQQSQQTSQAMSADTGDGSVAPAPGIGTPVTPTGAVPPAGTGAGTDPYQIIAQYYQQYLGRAGTPQEYDPWIQDYGTNNWGAVETAIRTSPEAAAYAATQAAVQPGTTTTTTGPFNKQVLWDFLQGYPHTPAGLKAAYDADPSKFGGAKIIGSKGDKLQLPDGTVVDVITNAGMGGTGWQWITGSGGGGSVAAPKPAPLDQLPGMPDEFWNYETYLKGLPEYNAPDLMGADQANLQALLAALANPQWSDERAAGMKEVQKEQAISMEEQARQQAQQLAASQGRAYGAGTDRRIEDASLAQILGSYRDVNEQVANNRVNELLGISGALNTSMTGMTDRAQSNYAAEMERFQQALEMALAESNQRMTWAEIMERAKEFYDQLGYNYAALNVNAVT